jgi:competence protein ComEA
MIRNIAVFLFAISSLAPLSSAQDFPAGAGKDTFMRICSGCHEPVVVTDSRRSRAGWEDLVGNMMGMGAQANDTEFEQIVAYLTASFGTIPAKTKVSVNTASAKDLTAGLGFTAAEGDSIVAYRTKNGNFASVDDLKKVPGVDAAKIEAAKDRIAF